MRDPSRTRTQPLAAVLVLVLESDPAGRCCGAALLVDDSELGMSSPLSLPASTSTSTASLSTSTRSSTSTILRGRSMRGAAFIGKATGPTKTTRFSHRHWTQLASRVGRPGARVDGRPFRWPDSPARNFAWSKCCAARCGRVSWRCGSRTPGEPGCRFKQHDSGTIGCTGDLGVFGCEPRLNCSVPVIRTVLATTSHVSHTLYSRRSIADGACVLATPDCCKMDWTLHLDREP